MRPRAQLRAGVDAAISCAGARNPWALAGDVDLVLPAYLLALDRSYGAALDPLEGDAFAILVNPTDSPQSVALEGGGDELTGDDVDSDLVLAPYQVLVVKARAP